MMNFRGMFPPDGVDMRVFLAEIEDGPVEVVNYQGGNPVPLAFGYAKTIAGQKSEYWITREGEMPYAVSQVFNLLETPKLSTEQQIYDWLHSKMPDGTIRAYDRSSPIEWPNIESLDFELHTLTGDFVGFYTIRPHGDQFPEAAILRGDLGDKEFPFNFSVSATYMTTSPFGEGGSPRGRMERAMLDRKVYVFKYRDQEMTKRAAAASVASQLADIAGLPITDKEEIEDGPVHVFGNQADVDYLGVGHRPTAEDAEWWELPRSIEFPFRSTVFLNREIESDEQRESIEESALYCRSRTAHLPSLSPRLARLSGAAESDWPAAEKNRPKTLVIEDSGAVVGLLSHRRVPKSKNEFIEAGIVLPGSKPRSLPLNFSATLRALDVDPLSTAEKGVYMELLKALKALVSFHETPKYFIQKVTLVSG